MPAHECSIDHTVTDCRNAFRMQTRAACPWGSTGCLQTLRWALLCHPGPLYLAHPVCHLEGIATNLDAVLVKMEDLRDNSDITRLKGVTEKDLKRTEKYHKSFIRLKEAKKELEFH